ncbi:MAG: hypothetical protein IKO85_06135 [Bacteroidaceae bacterium]|nr:hypothetical protein [Bacteroidaceae bacterium]
MDLNSLIAECTAYDFKQMLEESGYRLARSQRGVNILRMSDGTVRKAVVK